MRKFNLKGKVAQKLKGVDPAADDRAADSSALNQPETAVHQDGDLRYAWRTDVGRIRKNNQDSVILGNGLFGVADGMGGHNGGEIASAGLRDGLLRETEGQVPSTELLKEAVKKVNLEIWERQEKDASLTGMGTTLTILWPTEKDMIIGQVGDSRAYLIRGGRMTQMTLDHSMVADMVRRGVLTEEQAACHPMRNYITRAVGTDDTIEVDITTVPRMNGDRWIVCSDGLYGQLSKAELEETAKTADPEEAATELLKAALEHGGKDNISFIVLDDMLETADSAPADPEASLQPENGDPEQKAETAETTEDVAAENTDRGGETAP